MKKNISVLIAALLLLLSLVGCSAPEKKEEVKTKVEVQQAVETPAQSQEETVSHRTIVDLSGKEVKLPRASELKRVVIIAPPLMATYIGVTGTPENIVGASKGSLSNMHPEILEALVPNHKEINTSFLDGYRSNTEEVLAMNPDVILVYGDFQKEGLENIDVPVVDFFIKNFDNETWSTEIDRLMRVIFEKEEDQGLKEEWAKAKAITDPILKAIPVEERKTALMVRDNNAEGISARGKNSYGDDWLKITGLINMTGDLEGGENVTINVEQLYAWNPDIIYCFGGEPAKTYFENKTEGKDYAVLKAFQDKAIYDMPKGMFNWGAPNVDSPLTLLWMTMKNYPGKIQEAFFHQYMKDYYKRNYDLALSDELLERILNP